MHEFKSNRRSGYNEIWFVFDQKQENQAKKHTHTVIQNEETFLR